MREDSFRGCGASLKASIFLFFGEIGLETDFFVESKLNLFICELMVLVCHIHHVTNEALKELLEIMKNFVAGDNTNNGNTSIQRLALKQGSLERHRGTGI
jgi:predicted RecB family endonuclease